MNVISKKEKRIKLAEFHGFEKRRARSHFGFEWAKGEIFFKEEELPNYFSNLDDVHSLESVLTDDQLEQMEFWLRRIVTNRFTHPNTYPVGFKSSLLWRANAEQRAEAIGLSLKLW